MKLFGSRKDAARIQKKDQGEGKAAKLLLIIGLCLLAVVGGALLAVKLTVKPISIKEKPTVRQTTENGETVETEALKSHIDGVYNVLLCGTDKDGYRTDTIIIAHLDTRTHSAALMSIPRDAAIIRGDRLSKINSVYANGKEEGMLRLADALEEMLGIPMDAYILVDLDAFKASVDLIGGVWFDVPQDMFYEDPSQDLYINLKQGYQLLDGEHAMQLVRYRKGYASADIQRTSVQQDFLFAFSDQCIQSLSISKISALAKIFKTYVTTDMTTGNMLYFASEIKKCTKENISSYTVQGAGTTVDGISYYPLFDWSVLEIVNESFNPYDTQITASDIFVVTPNMTKRFDTTQEAQTPEIVQIEPEESEAEEAESEQTEQTQQPQVEEFVPPDNPTPQTQTPQPEQTDTQQTQQPAEQTLPAEWLPSDNIVAEWGYDPAQQDAG